MPRTIPQNATVYGIDLGKNLFHVVSLDSSGAVVQRARFRRQTLLTFFERANSAVVGMEACPGSQWLARKLSAMGHHGSHRSSSVRQALRQVSEERHDRRCSHRRSGDATNHALYPSANRRAGSTCRRDIAYATRWSPIEPP